MRRSFVLAAPVATVALASLLAGACSSDSDSSPGTTVTTSADTSSTTATTAGEGTTTTSTTTPSNVCRTDELEAELGPTNAGAGQIYNPLILRNTGSRTCDLTGFPGVSVLDGSGNQIGEPATRDGAVGTTVSLAPGAVASSLLHTTNEGIGGAPCEPTSAQMKVFPPDETAELTFAAQYTVCGGFSVTSLVPGDTGTA